MGNPQRFSERPISNNNQQPLKSFLADRLRVEVHRDRRSMGEAAAVAVGEAIRRRLAGKKDKINIVFATGDSQLDFLDALKRISNIEWSRVRAFHLDEYLGMTPETPQSFVRFLRERLFDHVYPGEIHYLRGDASDPQRQCEQYAELLRQHPLDIACIGIGENGHLAFNDPPVADFSDPLLVKIVTLDTTCRQQQVNDGFFATLEQVPYKALTLTIPAVMAAAEIHCIVPGPRKAAIVARTLTGPVDETCPASILRRHANATLYLDSDSASRLG